MKYLAVEIVGGYYPSIYDNFFAGSLLMIIVLIFILTLNWVFRKKSNNHHIEEVQELGNYTLAFSKNQVKEKQLSIFTKSVLYIMAAIIIYTPFDEIIRQFGPYYGNSAWNWLVW